MGDVPAAGVGSLALALAVLSDFNGCTPRECVPFHSPRIESGRTYRAELPRGLALELHPEYDDKRRTEYGGDAWHITVGPLSRPRSDYVWVVSWQGRSQHPLFIGPALDWTAQESLRLTPRRLRFVLTDHDYREAEAVARAAILHPRRADADRLGKGTLTLDIVDAKYEGNKIEWLEVRGQACVPK